MFGLSLGHIILFGLILLIFVGPEQLPEVARTIARVLNELKRATSDFQTQFQADMIRSLEQKKQQQTPPAATPESVMPEAQVLPDPHAPHDPHNPHAPIVTETPPKTFHNMTPEELSPSGHGYPDDDKENKS